jgi:hypothetical protein
MDTSMLIRTFTVGLGAVPGVRGVAAGSTPEGEHVETLHKAERERYGHCRDRAWSRGGIIRR